MAALLPSIGQLPTAPASTIKKLGWKGVMRSLGDGGKLVVTNHNEPEAVILSTSEYDRLLAAVRAAQDPDADPLRSLRRQFDARLAALNAPDAGDRLRDLMKSPGRLDGEVKAGETY